MLAQLQEDVLATKETYRGDIDLSVCRIDLEQALNSLCLTVRQRQCIALHFFANLKEIEIARVLCISQSKVSEHIKEALNNLRIELTDRHIQKPQALQFEANVVYPEISKWMIDVANNKPRWWIVPDNVIKEIQSKFEYVPIGAEEKEEEYDVHKLQWWLQKHKKEVLVRDVYIKPPRITRNTRRPIETMKGEDYINMEKVKFHVRMPHDQYIKKHPYDPRMKHVKKEDRHFWEYIIP